MTKPMLAGSRAIRSSSFGLLSSFGIRHSSFTWRESARGVNFLDHFERSFRFVQTRHGRALQTNVFLECAQLQSPRIVSARIFPHGRFGRPHFGKHFVMCEPFHAVASAQTFDVQLSLSSINL